MKISICITALNEEKSIGDLIDSLIKQTKKADECIIIDAGSKDKTINIINSFIKKHKEIILIKKKSSRARARNIAIKKAKNEIIAITDAGCMADKYWLELLTKPFSNNKTDVVAGFYNMRALNNLEKAFSVYLGVSEKDFNTGFLPSTRSLAFRKSVWERVGGFDENLFDTAEDTLFNTRLIKHGMKITRVKNAVVEWGMPNTLGEFFNKTFSYAKGDVISGIWFHPMKNKTSHNIHSLLIFSRYLLGFIIFYISVFQYETLIYPILLIVFYSIFSFLKSFRLTKEIKAAIWSIIVQFVSDLAVMTGFLKGIIEKYLGKRLRSLIYFSIIIWLIVLFFRSIIYIKRIFNEYNGSINPYYPQITVCGDKNNLNTDEEIFLYQYRNLGVTCEK